VKRHEPLSLIGSGPYSEGRFTGVKTPSQKSAQKLLDLPFCCTVEHVQLKNVTADVMNIIVTITVGVKCAPECIKMHHFEGENTSIHTR